MQNKILSTTPAKINRTCKRSEYLSNCYCRLVAFNTKPKSFVVLPIYYNCFSVELALLGILHTR